MKYFLVSIAVLGLVVSSVVEAQYYIQWADTIDNGSGDRANGVAVDGSDNIIVTGWSAIEDDDYFTVKYDPSGVILWADTIDNGDNDNAYGVAVDGSDNIIVTGFSKIGASYGDYFTVKYDPSGVILWADTLDNGDNDYAYGVAVDGSDNIIVTGSSKIGGDYDYFTVKYDSSGVVLWADTLDNSAADWAYGGVAVDGSDNIIVTGFSWIEGPPDYFTVKYDSSGAILWADTIDNGDWDGAECVAVDGSDNIIVTGGSEIGVDRDYFTVKYDSSGVILWADTIDNGDRDWAYAVAVDGSDNIIVTGYSGWDRDYFTVKYDPSGVILWADTIDNGDNDYAYGVAVDNSDYVIVTGESLFGVISEGDYFTVKYAPSIGVEDIETGFATSLWEVYPNPLTSNANITFIASKKTEVKLDVYDVGGRLIQTIIDDVKDAGEYNVLWDSSSRPAGVYFLKFEAGNYSETKKLLKVR